MKRGVYHITIGDHEYEVEADSDEQAQRIGDFIHQQAAAGNPDLKDVELPYSAVVEQGGAKAPETSAAGSFERGVNSMFLGNWDDELAGLGNALGMAPIENFISPGAAQEFGFGGEKDFWTVVRENAAKLDALKKGDSIQHPMAQGAGHVAALPAMISAGGGLARTGANLAARVAPRATIPAAMALEASRLSAPIRTAAAESAVVGGATGAVAGAGEGDTVDSRIKSAKLGAAAGTVLGGTLGAGIAGLAPAIGRYWNVLRGNNTEQEAVQQIITALGRDGYDVSSPAGVQALRAELSRYTTKPVSLADIGVATRARTGVGLRAPSDMKQQAEDIVTQRAAGQGNRLATDIRATVAPRTDVHALDEALVAQRDAEAMPLREQALFEQAPVGPPVPMDLPVIQDEIRRNATGIAPITGVPAAVPEIAQTARISRQIDDPVLNQLMGHPLAARGLTEALNNAQSERLTLQAQGLPVDHLPDMTTADMFDVRTMDTLKRYLDQAVDTMYKRGETKSFSAAEAGQLEMLRDALRDRMREVIPHYGDYLDAYRGSSEMRRSLEEGRDFTNLDPEQIITGQAKRSDAGKELYRVGAARNLLDTIRSTRVNANPASRILNSPEAIDQVSALGVAPDDLTRLRTSVEQERTLNLLPAELSGSQTAARVAAAQDADAGANLQLPFNVGSPVGWFGAGIRAVGRHMNINRNAAVNEAILPRLLETNPEAIEGIISELQRNGQTIQAAQLRRQLNARRSAAVFGTAIGGPVALPQGDQ